MNLLTVAFLVLLSVETGPDARPAPPAGPPPVSQVLSQVLGRIDQLHTRRDDRTALAEEQALVQQALSRAGRDFGVLSPQTIRVGTQDAKRALILAGVGWGRLPCWSIETELDGGSLVPLPTANWGPGGEKMTDAYLAWRLDQSLGIAARHLRELLRGSRPQP